MQDPVHSVFGQFTVHHVQEVLSAIHSNIGSTGWTEDDYNGVGTAFGKELFIHTASGFGNEAFVSMKSFTDVAIDRSALAVWLNTNYDAGDRVDAQPVVVAKTQARASNFRTEAFVASHPTGSFDTIDGLDPDLGSTSRKSWLNAYSTLESGPAWIIYDGVARSISAIWYLGNILQGFSCGKVYFDDESGKTDGLYLAAWGGKYENRNAVDATNGLPIANSSAPRRTAGTDDEQLLGIVGQLSPGGEVFPPGTPVGPPIATCSLVVVNEGRIEAVCANDYSLASHHLTPDIPFDQPQNAGQPATFPDPPLGTFYEPGTGRRYLARVRAISRFPNGGAIPLGSALGTGCTDWQDSGYSLPWSVIPTAFVTPGQRITGGAKEWICFPMNRGASQADPIRTSGIAFRTA